MLSDAQWAELEPLVEACRPKGKTPPEELRRTLSAILWRHRNGARWRAIPQELGPWWQAAQLFIRRAHAGVWERLLDMAQQRGVRLSMVFLDGTNIRAENRRGPGPRPCAHRAQDRDERGWYYGLAYHHRRWPPSPGPLDAALHAAGGPRPEPSAHSVG